MSAFEPRDFLTVTAGNVDGENSSAGSRRRRSRSRSRSRRSESRDRRQQKRSRREEYSGRRRSRSKSRRNRRLEDRDSIGVATRVSGSRRSSSAVAAVVVASRCDPPPKAPLVIVRTVVDYVSVPLTDWWCQLCSNPNPVHRNECSKCGQFFCEGDVPQASSDLMTEVIPGAAVPHLRSAVVRGALGAAGQSAACDYAESGDTVEFIKSLVCIAVSGIPECNTTLLHTVHVMMTALGSEGASAQAQKGPGVGVHALLDEGYVAVLGFCTAAQARQCLLSTGSRIVLPGICRTSAPWSVDGVLRLGFSTVKPLSRPAQLRGVSLPILDITEMEPQAPVWSPPVLDDLNALKNYLTGLFQDWDTLLPAQKEFYEANISRVQSLTSAAASVVMASSSAEASTARSRPTALLSASLGSSLSDIKKRMEEKRQALLQKKQQKETDSDAAAPPQPLEHLSSTCANPSASSCGGTGSTSNDSVTAAVFASQPVLSVLERLALKKAQILQKQQPVMEPCESGTSTAASAGPSPTSTGAPTALPATESCDGNATTTAASRSHTRPLLFHLLFPVSPNFPVRPDHHHHQNRGHPLVPPPTPVKQVHVKAAIKLHGIPMEVASRVLPAFAKQHQQFS